MLGAFGIAIVIACTQRWIPAAAGAGFAASTLAGYLLSVWRGLFGFREVRTTAGLVAGAIEVAAVTVLTTSVVLTLSDARAPSLRTGHAVAARGSAVVVAAASVLAITLLGASAAVAAGPPSPAAGGSPRLDARVVAGVRVLTTSAGLTLYWFSPDTPTTSRCTGPCTAYWPPITGTAALAPGVTGTLGTIERAGRVVQATYDGHPPVHLHR